VRVQWCGGGGLACVRGAVKCGALVDQAELGVGGEEADADLGPGGQGLWAEDHIHVPVGLPVGGDDLIEAGWLRVRVAALAYGDKGRNIVFGKRFAERGGVDLPLPALTERQTGSPAGTAGHGGGDRPGLPRRTSRVQGDCPFTQPPGPNGDQAH
jgi:hypothetical protein